MLALELVSGKPEYGCFGWSLVLLMFFLFKPVLDRYKTCFMYNNENSGVTIYFKNVNNFNAGYHHFERNWS